MAIARIIVGEFLTRVGGFEKCRQFEHHGEVKMTDVVVRRMQGGPVVSNADVVDFLHDDGSETFISSNCCERA